MTLRAVSFLSDPAPAPVQGPSVATLSAPARAQLVALREAARWTRARPHRPLMATGEAEAGHTDPYETLVQCLPQALAGPLVIYRHGEPGLSFDEAWVLGLLDRLAAEDWDSLQFLIARRVARPARVAVRVLLGACQTT